MGSGEWGPEVVVLLESRRAVYVEVPKVACSSIKIALAGVLGIDLGAAGGNPHLVELPAPRGDPASSGPPYPGLFSFAFVRNPWDRLVSCYRDKVNGEAMDFTGLDRERGVAHCLARFDSIRAGMSFEEFVEAVAAIPDEEADEHFRSQHRFVCDRNGALAVDFLGRFESLEADWARVCGVLDLPGVVLPRTQVSGEPVRYEEYYSAESRELVRRRFARDVERFGYSFGERPRRPRFSPPRLVEEAPRGRDVWKGTTSRPRPWRGMESETEALGLESGTVRVVSYDRRWPHLFEVASRELRIALGSSIVAVLHVGSTSVPGLCAKPILDILVTVPDFEASLELVPRLEDLGYEYRPDEEIPDRHYFRRRRGTARTHHLSLAEASSRHHRVTLAFRDALRADPSLASDYAGLKLHLARRFPRDRQVYLEGKSGFIARVLGESGLV